jgi:GMP synthase (glutamine-hydrolysing)
LSPDNPNPQIAVLDTGGQYCHLISRKVRELGVYADVRPSETPAGELSGRRGVIISGGPASVYDSGSPTIDPALLAAGVPILGLCYGHQLIAHLLGGVVRKGQRGEFGFARLSVEAPGPLLRELPNNLKIWMSHRDQVQTVPPGFRTEASTDTCAIAAMSDWQRRLFGLQFHPEVAHTERGADILRRFVFDVCGCTPDWDPSHRAPIVEQQIRDVVGTRSVIFFVSGGVDSSVAYTLCLRALGPDRVRGFYVDTGLMREGESGFVREAFPNLEIVDSRAMFLERLAGIVEPEGKRKIIGEAFVAVQERILERGHFLDGNWILGQGTIYPDTIESGGTAKADLIKTHHNRVAGIQRLIAAGRIVEPLSLFYKDEVRQVGSELGLPGELLHRHPFPGPGLAIRCLCSAEEAALRHTEHGWIVPVHSVGVQGDSRSYRPVLAVEQPVDDPEVFHRATALINELSEVNRVVALVGSHAPLGAARVTAGGLTAERLDRLRRADGIVREMSHRAGFDAQIWQFPVVLIPVGAGERPDSVVLRPIDSVDGMTAQAVAVPADLRAGMAEALMAVDGVFGVFCDLTNKPPATIEWE